MTKVRELRPSAGRVPPAAVDAEAAVLSSCLLSPDTFEAIENILAREHFYDPRHGLVFGAIAELRAAERTIDTVAVAGVLRGHGRLEQAGGAAYLAELVDATPAVAHVEDHARAVHEKWRLRTLIATCQRVAAEAYGDTGNVQGFVEDAHEAIERLRVLGGPKEQASPIRLRDLASGMATPDEPLAWVWTERHQIAPGRPAILGAYGGLGKTWLVLAAALSVATGIPFLGSPPAKRGRAIVLSYETGGRRLLRRLRRLVHGYAVTDGLDDLQFAAQEDLGAFLNDPATEGHLVDLCTGAQLLVIDALLQGSPGLRENDSEIATPLHMLGRVSARTDCAILVIHHERKTSEDTAGAAAGQALRGHSALHAAADAIWSMRPLAGDVVALRPTKTADGRTPRGWDITVTDTDGGGVVLSWKDAQEAQSTSVDDVRAAVLAHIAEHGPAASKNALCQRIGKNRQAVLAAIDELTAEGHEVIRKGSGGGSRAS